MLRSFRLLILLLIVLLLLTGSSDLSAITAARSTTVTDRCPDILKQMSSCLTPYMMRMAYGINPLIQEGYTGAGQTIIDIVSFGSPTLQEDMNVFDRTFGLPPADLQVITPLHIPEYDPRHDKEGWAEETELDVEIIHALAPEAKIIVLQSPIAETEGITGLPQFRQLQQYVIDHQLGNIVSQSWGASELTLQNKAAQQELQQWDHLFRQGTLEDHITYLSASGDTGATDYIDANSHLAHIPVTSFAPDSPWVTGVGATTLWHAGSVFHETAWNDYNYSSHDGASSSGGFSNFYAMPSYQKFLPDQTQRQFGDRRGVPDVSADGDPQTGLAVYMHGQWALAGGTSASTPLWAAIIAIANQMAGHPLGFINPALYKLAVSSRYQEDFHDITEGDNSNRKAGVIGYSAAPGWDAVTGLGTPNAQKLVPDLIAAMP